MDVTIDPGKPGRVEVFINGKSFGHPLRDNRYEEDGYRFHDIFHLTYAAVLGWSPTLRALMRRKRKSDPRVDEVEDGGRAIVIEEGISAMVFSYAERRDFLSGAEAVNYELLRTIKDMTSHLEVKCRTEGDWEHAILKGFELWRQVRANGKGRLLADLDYRDHRLDGMSPPQHPGHPARQTQLESLSSEEPPGRQATHSGRSKAGEAQGA